MHPHKKWSSKMTVEDDYVDYWELGFNLYKTEPELILAKVWWRAGELSKHQEDQFNFVFGYAAARQQQDEYSRKRVST
jgi:hypothetical protein